MTTLIISAVISIIMLIIGCKLLLNVKKIKRNGVEAEGMIFDFNRGQPVDNTSASYYPVVRFPTKDDSVWITKESRIGVPSGVYKAGAKVRIIYEQNNPQNFFIDDKYTRLVPKLFLCIAVLLFAFCIIKLIIK